MKALEAHLVAMCDVDSEMISNLDTLENLSSAKYYLHRYHTEMTTEVPVATVL